MATIPVLHAIGAAGSRRVWITLDGLHRLSERALFPVDAVHRRARARQFLGVDGEAVVIRVIVRDKDEIDLAGLDAQLPYKLILQGLDALLGAQAGIN